MPRSRANMAWLSGTAMPWRCAASTTAPVMYSCSSGRPARRSCNIEVPPSAGRGRFEAVERFRIFEWHDQSRPCFFKIYLQSRAEVGNARLWPESHHRAENICRCLSRAIPDSGGSAAIANRHSFASFLVNEGVSLYVVQGLLAGIRRYVPLNGMPILPTIPCPGPPRLSEGLSPRPIRRLAHMVRFLPLLRGQVRGTVSVNPPFDVSSILIPVTLIAHKICDSVAFRGWLIPASMP